MQLQLQNSTPLSYFRNRFTGIPCLTIITYLILVMATGCKKSTVVPVAPSAPTSSTPNPVFNKLGWGYDAAGQYANVSSTRGYVIDVAAFQKSEPARLINDIIQNSESNSIAGENSLAFTSALTAKVDVSAFKLFKGSVSFYDSSYYRSDVIYAEYQLEVQQRHLKLNATLQMLQNYLTPEFKADLQNLSPEALIQAYGTHVLVDAILGASLEVMYHSNTTTSYQNRRDAAEAGLGESLKMLFSINLTGNTNQTLASTDYNQDLHYRTIGGNSAVGLVGTVNLDGKTPNQVSISAWQASITPDNSQLIDFGGTDGLIMLSDLVQDPAKSLALKTAITKYLNDNTIVLQTPPSPIYMYYVYNTGPHAYSSSMLPSILGNYTLVGQVFQAYTSASAVPNLASVHQFYNAGKNIWAYSTKSSPDLDGFSDQGICYYAFSTQMPGTVPLYEYYYEIKSNKKLYYDTYYSTSNQIPGNDPSWHFESIVCYVYP